RIPIPTTRTGPLPEALRTPTPTAIRRARRTATQVAPAPTAAPTRTAAPTPLRPPAATPPTTAIPRLTASPRRTPGRMIGPTPRPIRTPTVRTRTQTRGPRARAAATRIPPPRARTPVRTKAQRIPRTTMTVPAPHWARPTPTAAPRTRRPATALRTDERPFPDHRRRMAAWRRGRLRAPRLFGPGAAEPRRSHSQGRHRSHHRRRPALAPGGPEPLALVRRVHHLDHRQLLAGLRPRRLRNGRSRLHHLPHGTSRKAGMTPAWTSSTPNCA